MRELGAVTPTRSGKSIEMETHTAHVRTDAAHRKIFTRRLLLRPWSLEDADAAFAVYGSEEVIRWLEPMLTRVESRAAMTEQLSEWVHDSGKSGLPQGRWAVEESETGRVVGGVSLLPLPPDHADLEIGWHLIPEVWGRGFGAEAGHAVAHQAFESGVVSEVFAVVQPDNERGVQTARRVGMEWVGETSKYYGVRQLVYRLTMAELDYPRPR